MNVRIAALEMHKAKPVSSYTGLRAQGIVWDMSGNSVWKCVVICPDNIYEDLKMDTANEVLRTTAFKHERSRRNVITLLCCIRRTPVMLCGDLKRRSPRFWYSEYETA